MTDTTGKTGNPDAVANEAAIVPVQWVVQPAGIENTRFADPESFYLSIKRTTWQDRPAWVVTPGQSSVGFTKHGKLVYLRHDVNAKHARHASFEDAVALAKAIVNGDLPAEGYQTWQKAEAAHFGAPGGKDSQ